MGELEIRNVRIGLSGAMGNVRIVDGHIRQLSRDTGHSSGEHIDGGGRTLLPGLRDMHTHLPSVATVSRRIDVSDARTAEQAAAIVAQKFRGGEVAIGRGMRDALWPTPPHKDILEAELPGVAVLISGNDGHTAWLSPAALARIGKADHPTGVLVEQECFGAGDALEAVDPDQLRALVSKVTTTAATRGLTQVQDFDPAPLEEWITAVQDYGTDLRIICGVRGRYVAEALEAGLRTGDQPAGVDGLLTVGPIKLFADGSLNTRTALLDVPYAGGDEANLGSMELSPDELDQCIRQATTGGLEVAIHAIGNRANNLVLDAFERVGVPGRIEHAQLVRADDLPRFAQLGVVASVQPAHQPDDRDVADRYWSHNAGQAYPYAGLLASGARLEFGSDAPVAPLDPWDGIASAVTRTDDERPPWRPEQALTVDQAIAATCGGRTTVTEGDIADLVIVDEDPATVSPADLRQVPVHATMLGGRWTYRSPAFG